MPSRNPGSELRTFLRRLPVALAAAVAIWALARPAYEPALGAAAQFVARIGEWPQAALVLIQGHDAVMGRSDMRVGSAWLRLPLTQIHFNLVPFLALALALPKPLAGGAWRRGLVALAAFAVSHVLGLVWQVKSFEAMSLGPWSLATYSNLARDVYTTLRYFFELPVTFALPLALWVAVYPDRVFALVGFTADGRD